MLFFKQLNLFFLVLRIRGDKVDRENAEVSLDVKVKKLFKTNSLNNLTEKLEVLADRKTRTFSRIRDIQVNKILISLCWRNLSFFFNRNQIKKRLRDWDHYLKRLKQL